MLENLEVSPEDSILDSSAGTGLLAEQIISNTGSFKRLVLNDPAKKMLSVAKSRLSRYDDISYTSYFAEEFHQIEDSFTQIICLNSFHYYVDQQQVLNHYKNLLDPDGFLWILDWNRVGTFRVASKLIDWLSPENINTRTLTEMKKMLNQTGFTVESEDEWGFRWWNFMYLKCRLNDPNLKQT